jgi:hypothetical protein
MIIQSNVSIFGIIAPVSLRPIIWIQWTDMEVERHLLQLDKSLQQNWPMWGSHLRDIVDCILILQQSSSRVVGSLHLW